MRRPNSTEKNLCGTLCIPPFRLCVPFKNAANALIFPHTRTYL